MRIIRKSLWLLLLFLSAAARLSADDERILNFLKGPDRPVADNVRDKEILSIALVEREMEATLLSFGKAHPLSDQLLARLKAKDGQVYQQAKKITTSVKLRQDGNEFYVRGFQSIAFSRLQPGKRVKCRLFLVALRTKERLFYLPLIRTIEML
jgi:hypothetical protein